MRRALLVLAAAAALLAPARPARTAPEPLPILMYHVIAPPLPAAPYPGLYVRPADLARQLDLLAAHGYHAVTLDQMYEAWHVGAPLPSRPIVLSFDDGYRSDYVTAMPLLRARGWPGVLNLEVANLHRPWGLSPNEVRGLIRAGWEIDAHTITHPDLTTLGPAALHEEVAGSRVDIRREFGVPVNFFCYPAGRYDAAVERAVRDAGFEGATTVREGLARPDGDPYALDRIRVSGTDGARGRLPA